MPRNSAGTYTLPAGNPVVAGTTIDASWANDTMSDMANEITNSLSRTGAGGMLAPFRVADGSVSAPGLGFTNETNSGIYRAGTGELWFTIGGVAVAQITGSGLLIPSGKRISVPTPVNASDATPKSYVDVLIGYADFYLGPKSSDPSVNNSGGALTEGATYWSTTLDQMRVYNGTTWEPMPSTASLQGQTFSGDGVDTTFTLAAPTGNATNLEVFISGVRQVPTTDYTVSGTTLTFTSAPPSGTDNIYVRFAQLIALASADSSNVSYLPAGTGAVATTVQSKLRETVSVEDFGADPTGVADSATALNNAFASGASDVRMSGAYLIGANVNVPSGVNVLAEPGTTITSNGSGNFIVTSDSLIENIAFDFGSSARRVYGDNASSITFRNCSATGSTGNGFDLFNGPVDILFENCTAYGNSGYGIAALGSTTQRPNRITIRGCKTYSNLLDGICVAGVGQKTTPVQSALYARNIVISDCISNSNGSGGAFNGITTPYCQYVTFANCLTYSNAEHGIALQETFDFTISNVVSYSNGQAGICMQSGYDPFNPTARGVVTGVHCYGNANEGLALKEKCEYLTFTGCNFTGNTQYSVRLRDIGASGLVSTVITFVGCAFAPSGGSGFTNSNSSTAVTSSSSYNYDGIALQPNRTLTASLSTTTTIDTRGATLNYPETFVLTNSGTQVSRTLIAQATLGRRITLMADASGSVGVRHNQGDGVTYAGFLNSAAATVTLGAWKNITYVGNGTDWVEVAKNT